MIGEQLTEEQVLKLQQIIKEFDQVLQNQPGWTGLVKHKLETGSARPVQLPPYRLPPYRLPQAYRDSVHKELQEMLQQDIIEHSSSEWAAPIVLVKKKDGGICLYVEYRRLNTVSGN